jgi:ubiquinone/menaquinone biosynthesis C-methylase UbiE
MPDETMWQTFFNPEQILRKLGLNETCENAVDLGCGYGTFSIPAAKMVKGTVYAIDIEPQMIAKVREKARAENLSNIETIQQDFVTGPTDLKNESVDYVMLFNILHAEDPLSLLKEAKRILSGNGKLGVIHWNYDPQTPRGPSMTIRPRPEQCIAWALQAGFKESKKGQIDLPPYHYGLIFEK